MTRGNREGLLLSLENPHPETKEVAEAGLAEWGARLSAVDEGLLDASAGKPVRWVAGKGWTDDPG